MSSKADLVSDTELVPAQSLPNGLSDPMTDAKQDSTPLVDVAAVPKAPMLVSNNNQSLHSMPYLDTAAPLEGASATTQSAPISPVSNDKVVNSHSAVATKVELLPLQKVQADNCSASDASVPAVTDCGAVEQVGKPDAAAVLKLLKVDTAAMAGMSAQSLATSAAEDSALSPQQISHTVSRDVTDANETTEATGGVMPITKPAAEATGGVVPITTPAAEGTGGVVPITASQNNTEATGGVVPITTPQSNIEATGGVVPITTPAAEVQQAAQQQVLLAHPASAGKLDATSDMLLYNGSKQQDAHSLSAQPIEVSGPVVSATTSAADSLVDAALRENSITAKPSRKEIAERPIAGDLSSPDLEVIMGPEDTIPGRVTDPKSFLAQPDDIMTSVLPPSAATPSLTNSALMPGSADAGTQQPTDSDEEGLHAMPGR